MKLIRRSDERGHADHGWLDSRHTFSFAGYHDPDHMGFRALRVFNDDRVAAGQGFGEHPHRDMEIISIVLEGALEHRDSMGSGAVLRPGDVQAMSAGTGIVHSEFNGSKSEPVHFLQLWVIPESTGAEPRYADRTFDPASMDGRYSLQVSGDGRDGSLEIGRDVDLWRGRFPQGADASLTLRSADRHAWIHVTSGSAVVSGEILEEGDAIGLSGQPAVSIEAGADGVELVVLDLD